MAHWLRSASQAESALRMSWTHHSPVVSAYSVRPNLPRNLHALNNCEGMEQPLTTELLVPALDRGSPVWNAAVRRWDPFHRGAVKGQDVCHPGMRVLFAPVRDPCHGVGVGPDLAGMHAVVEGGDAQEDR